MRIGGTPRTSPFIAGCARPLLRPLADGGGHSTAIHWGEKLGLPEPAMPLQAQHGVDFIIETLARGEPGSITLAALGPLTDIAMALVKAPDIAAGIGEVVVMGGAGFEIGNVTPAAEFNIHVDPHAAEIVLESGIPITMIPLDVTHQALSTPPRIAALNALGNRCGPAVGIACCLASKRPAPANSASAAWRCTTLCVIAYLLRPELFTGREVNVAVETASPLTTGMTVVDWWGVTGRKANARFHDDGRCRRPLRPADGQAAGLPEPRHECRIS